MPAAFSGDPKTLWIASVADSDRRMKLLEDFWFQDRHGDTWSVDAEYVIDGASIPRALWTLVGSPYTGQYRRASVVHDKACDDAAGNEDARRRADRMFFEACRAGGCGWFEAMILYAGVRIGAAWSTMAPELLAQSRKEGATLVRPPYEQNMIAEYQYLAERITRAGPTDDAKEVEKRADASQAELALMRTGLVSTA